MKSRALLVGVVAAVGAAGLLLLWPRSAGDEDPPPPASEQVEASDPAGVDGAPARQSRGTGARPQVRDRRASSGGEGSQAQEGDVSPGSRDNRGRPAPPPHPIRHGAAAYVVQPKAIVSVRNSLRPEIKKCTDQFADDVEPGAQIQGSLRVAVRSGMLSVLDVEIQHRGVPESSGLIECARAAFAAVQVRAEGHADVESHVVRFPFKVGVK